MSISLRMAIAFLLSAAIWLGVHAWHARQTAHLGLSAGNENPTAQILRIEKQVQQKPPQRQLWFHADSGDFVTNGTAIRTAAQSRAEIALLNEKRILEIEADSLVIVSESESEIDIQLQAGTIVARAPLQESSKAVTVRALDKKVSFANGGGEIRLEPKTQEVQVEVFNGSAELEENGQKTRIEKALVLPKNGVALTDSDFEILSPKTQRPWLMDGQNPQPIAFQWKAKAGSKASVGVLQLGVSKDVLVEPSVETKKQDGLHQIAMKPGTYYWRVAPDPRIYKLKVVNLFPATPIEPSNQQNIVVPELQNQSNQKIEFKWINSPQSPETELEVYRGEKCDQRVLKKSFTQTENHSMAIAPGQFCWRVLAKHPPSQQLLNQTFSVFTVSSKMSSAPPAETQKTESNLQKSPTNSASNAKPQTEPNAQKSINQSPTKERKPATKLDSSLQTKKDAPPSPEQKSPEPEDLTGLEAPEVNSVRVR